MGDIKAFLQPPVMDETREVVISKRFKGADGKPVPFTIRVINQETNGKLLRQATKKAKVNGQVMQEIDNERYGKLLVSACVVDPNFRNAELCDFYKTADPLDVPGRMLTVGEYNRLVREIKELNELAMTDDDFSELEEEAKN